MTTLQSRLGLQYNCISHATETRPQEPRAQIISALHYNPLIKIVNKLKISSKLKEGEALRKLSIVTFTL